MSEVSIDGLERAAVLAALYNANVPMGMGFMAYDPTPMTVEDAEKLLVEYDGVTAYFDYVHGRSMKLAMPPDAERIDVTMYDKNFPLPFFADYVIDILRKTGDPACEEILELHNALLPSSVRKVRGQMDTPTTTQQVDGATVVSMGLSDMKDALEGKLQERGL